MTVEAFDTITHLRALETQIEELRSSLLMWKLFFFVPLWLGVYATLVTVLFRATP